MAEFEQHGWQGFWLPGRKISGQHGVVVIIKRRFEVDMMSATCKPAVTPPIAVMQEPYDDGDPPFVSMRAPGEIAVEKPNVDLIVRGTAYAPGGKPVPQFDVEFRIPRLVQSRLRIIGDRQLVWYPPVKWLTAEDVAKGEAWIWPDPDFTEPEPIAKLPIRYEHAYGGWAKLILTPDVAAVAGEHKVIAEVVEERREKKKEILEDLKKKEAEKDKPKDDKPKPKDEKAAKLAAAAFGDGGGEQKLDDETAKKLADAEAADDGMKVVSAYRLGKDMPETAAEADAAKAAEEAAAKKDAPEEEEEEGEPKEEDPNAKFFSSSDGATSMLDISKLNLEDEFAGELDQRAQAEARKLKDEEGTLRDRATEFGDIQINDDSWAAKYVRAQPQKVKKKAPEKTDIPTMPYPTNLAGKGFVCSHMEEAVDKVPLPNIEDPDDLLQPEGFIVEMTEFDLEKLRVPAGWGTYPLGAYPRGKYWGPYPWDVDLAKAAIDKAKEDYDEEDPDDKPILEQLDKLEVKIIQPLAFQEAHPKLQVKEIRGDEDVYFTNLTPDGNLYFKLPGVHPTVTIDMSEGPEFLPVRIDQVLFDLDDPKQPAVEIVWRGFYKLKDFDELGTKPLRKIAIIEVDQEGWNEVQRKMLEKKKGAGEADVDEEAYDGKDLEEKYRAQFKRKKGGKGERLDDVSDAVVWDQDDERQLVHDEWDESIRADKQAFIDEQKAKAEAAAKVREKILKGQARELADEEFGIIRDPETGEILAVEPPEKPAGKGKKK